MASVAAARRLARLAALHPHGYGNVIREFENLLDNFGPAQSGTEFGPRKQSRRQRRAIASAGTLAPARPPPPKMARKPSRAASRRSKRGGRKRAAAAGAAGGYVLNRGGNASSNAMFTSSPSGTNQTFASPQGMGSAVYGNRLISMAGGCPRFVGKTLVGQVSPSETNSVVFSQEISPQQWANSWIRAQSQLWEQYKINKLAFLFHTSYPSTTNSNFAGYVDTDPRDRAVYSGADFAAAQSILGNERSVTFDAQGGTMMLPKPSQWLYTGAQPAGTEKRTYSAGAVTLAQIAPLIGFDGKPLPDESPAIFQVSVLYDITFRTMNQEIITTDTGGGGGGGGGPISTGRVFTGRCQGDPGDQTVNGFYSTNQERFDQLTIDVPSGTSVAIWCGANQTFADPDNSSDYAIEHYVNYQIKKTTTGEIIYDGAFNGEYNLEFDSLQNLVATAVAGQGYAQNATGVVALEPVTDDLTISVQPMQAKLGYDDDNFVYGKQIPFSYFIFANADVTVTEADLESDGFSWVDSSVVANDHFTFRKVPDPLKNVARAMTFDRARLPAVTEEENPQPEETASVSGVQALFELMRLPAL